MLYEVITEEMNDIGLRTGKKVIHTQDLMAFVQETFAKMGSDKTGSSGYQDSFHIPGIKGFLPIL